MMTRSARTLLSQLSLLPDGASLNDLKSLFPLNRLTETDDRPEKVLRALSLAYYDGSKNSLSNKSPGLDFAFTPAHANTFFTGINLVKNHAGKMMVPMRTGNPAFSLIFFHLRNLGTTWMVRAVQVYV